MERKILGTAVCEGKAVYVLAMTETEIMVTPIVSERGEVIFARPSEVSQLLPVNYQENTREIPKITSPLPDEYQPNTTLEGTQYQPDTNKARAALPPAPSLLELLEQRWSIIEALYVADYRGTAVRNFEELVQQIDQGELSVVPRPVYASVSQVVGEGKDRRLLIARTVKLFAEYRRKYYPSRPWLLLNSALDRVDDLLNYVIRIA